MGNQGSNHGSGSNGGSGSMDCQFTSPTGLYKASNSQWPVNEAKKLIQERRLAPRYPGTSSMKLSKKYGSKRLTRFYAKELVSTGPTETESAWEECPVCFRFYPEVNASVCCRQKICTECYLNVSQPNTSANDCPFCSKKHFVVRYVPSPHGRESAMIEMAACMRDSGQKNWEILDGESSEHLDTASIQTMRDLERESMKQSYQAEADRARMTLANQGSFSKLILEGYIPDDFMVSNTLSGASSFGSNSIESPMMNPSSIDELMLKKAIEDSLKLHEEEETKKKGSTAKSSAALSAEMLTSPMLPPTHVPGIGAKSSALFETATLSSESTAAIPLTSPLTAVQRNQKMGSSGAAFPSLTLPPSSASGTPTRF